MILDAQMKILILGLFGLLTVATGVAGVLRRHIQNAAWQETMVNLVARIKAWWLMVIVFSFSFLIGPGGSIVLFGCVSFLALREFITLTPTKRSDHRSLFWAFFVILPLQYYFLAVHWLPMFFIFIPVYAFLLIPIRSVMFDDYEHFLERTAKIQWAVMVCVYFVSYVPALLLLKIPGFEGQNAKLLFFLVFVVQASDVLQYIFGKCLGRTPIAPRISPNKTLEGFLGGIGTATLLGTGLWWATPFNPWQAAFLALIVTVMGFFGGLTMSAVKRDRGVKDYGQLIEGHGGMMDRIDSLCFAAPIFFHLVAYFFT